MIGIFSRCFLFLPGSAAGAGSTTLFGKPQSSSGGAATALFGKPATSTTDSSAKPAFGFGAAAAAPSSVSGVFGSSGTAGSTGSGVFGSGSTGGSTTGFGQSASTPAFGSLTASTTGTTPFGSGSGKSVFIQVYRCKEKHCVVKV